MLASVSAQIARFSARERWQTILFVAGAFAYKFAWESHSLYPYALNKFDHAARQGHYASRTFGQIGILSTLLLFFNVVGSSLVAPLTKRIRHRLVLGICAILKAILCGTLLSLEGATGGTIKPPNWEATHPPEDYGYYGAYNPYGLTPFFCINGLLSGVIGTMQRTIPRHIVGDEPSRLQFFNAIMQTFYETAAIAGALCSALVLIPRLGANFPIATPIVASLAALGFFLMKDFPSREAELHESARVFTHEPTSRPLHKKLAKAARDFFPFKALKDGAAVLCSSRELSWLVVVYPLTQYAHGGVEHTIASAVAKRYMGEAGYVQILSAGSNIGEFLGAIAALFLQPYITSPVPLVRLNALVTLLVWIFPFWYPEAHSTNSAWIAAAILLPIGMTWSAAAVSMYSFLQSLIPDEASNDDKYLPQLSCAISFLHTLEIILIGAASPGFGAYIDHVFNRTGGLEHGGFVQHAMLYVGGVQYTIIAALIIAATLWPRGKLGLNPRIAHPEPAENDRKDVGLTLDQPNVAPK